MTLEEGIIHAEDVARMNHEAAKHLTDEHPTQAEKCEACAKEHERLSEWLKELKAYKEQDSDAISRQAVIDILDDMVKNYVNENDFDKAQGIAWVKVQRLPSVTPQQRMGHWIFDEILDKHYYCSECKSMGVDYWDYCPNCGAKMEVEE